MNFNALSVTNVKEQVEGVTGRHSFFVPRSIGQMTEIQNRTEKYEHSLVILFRVMKMCEVPREFT